MFFLVEIAAVLAIIGVAASFFLRRGRETERQEITERRVTAYMQTIRREAANPQLAAMTDLELRDLLLSGARNLRLQSERRWYLLLGGGVAALFGAIIIATQDGTRGFGVALVIGGVVLYGINVMLDRQMREPLVARGIDVERLRVE